MELNNALAEKLRTIVAETAGICNHAFGNKSSPLKASTVRLNRIADRVLRSPSGLEPAALYRTLARTRR
jgi:hypothetical protein